LHRDAGRLMRLSLRNLIVIGAVLGLIVVFSTDQVLPASSAYQAQMRLWLAARAAGITAYLILTFIIAMGLILSHPVNRSTWKLSKRLFPWHENLFVFLLAFLAAHIVSIVLDPYAGVGIAGSFIPGLSSFRSVPVALGTLALYGLLITGLTARYTKWLPAGWWLKLHRLSIVVWALTWAHGILSGADTGGIAVMYVSTGLLILGAAAYRYWVSKQHRPTFATSLPDTAGGPGREPAKPAGGLAGSATSAATEGGIG
jgi:sulfoxide reductase heme-binding subunit YedZ